MKYTSTRGGVEAVAFQEALLSGYASDGGLFVPADIPFVDLEMLSAWKDLSYANLCKRILSMFIAKEEIALKTLEEIIESSFSRFHSSDVIPIKRLGDVMVAEMWHGPTGAFKDIALGVIAKLVNHFLGERGKHATVLVATSGDTGPAAIHAVLGSHNMDIIVMYPKGRISRIQELQMTTVDAENVTVYGGENCVADDLDTLVKNIFTDVDFSNCHNLIMLNSINIGRVVVQAVHYFYAYLKVCRSVGEEVLISVPTGACGNIAGGVLAQTMGLPVKFIVGVNHNDVVHTCIMSGSLDQHEDVIQSHASAMDVQIPYNMERVVSFITGDANVVSQQFRLWDLTGKMVLTPTQQAEIRKRMWSMSVSQDQIIKTMQDTMSQYKYHLCPHTAVGVFAATKFCNTSDQHRHLCDDACLSTTPIVCYATATLAKFKEVAHEAGITAPSLAIVDALYELPTKGRVLKEGNWEAIIRRKIEEISDEKISQN